MNKKEIRRSILAVRDGIPIGDRARFDDEIKKRLLTQSVYKEAEVILAYASYQSEVDTAALIRQALTGGKYVFVPKVSGEEMEFWQITGMEDLQEGYRGIPEPMESISFPEWIAGINKSRKCHEKTCHVMMWMPGAVFDKERHRIGYGKGFYDRYLSRVTVLKEKLNREYQTKLYLDTAALAYSCQILEQIPHEPHDVRPDMVITEEICIN